MLKSLTKSFEIVALFLQTKMEIARLNEEKHRFELVKAELSKKKHQLFIEQDLLHQYSRSLLETGNSAKPGQLVETDTLGMLLRVH